MSKQSRLRLLFAGLGLVVTAILYAAYALVPYSTNPPKAMMLLGFVSAFLCSPSLMSVSPLEIFEPPYAVGGPGLWLFIGLVNSALYAAIGTTFVGFRRKREGPATG
jgi:hypothetical protein